MNHDDQEWVRRHVAPIGMILGIMLVWLLVLTVKVFE